MKLFRAATALLLACLLAFMPLNVFAEGGRPSLSAKSAVLIDASSGEVLLEKNAREQMGMASTTKIMTALIAAERLPLGRVISIPREAVNTEGSSVYLCEGELLSVRELLYALLLASANDAAVALAVAVSGSVEAFAALMNERAGELGLTDTSFVNPHGLYDERHYTTAYDLAIISAAALKNSAVREIASSKRAIIPQGVTPECPEGISARYLLNHNKLLGRYKGAIGLKTGFTKKSGRCLVSAAERDGLLLIAVTLNAPDDWNDHTAMLDYGYSHYECVTLYGVGEFVYDYPVSGGCADFVRLANTQPITLTLPKNRSSHECTVTSHRRFELAPVPRGKSLAELTVSIEGRSVSSPLCAIKSVDRVGEKNKFKDFIWIP